MPASSWPAAKPGSRRSYIEGAIASKPIFGPALDVGADVLVDAEDLLDDDHPALARAVTAGSW